jgi:hypothetical protein
MLNRLYEIKIVISQLYLTLNQEKLSDMVHDNQEMKKYMENSFDHIRFKLSLPL